MYGLESVIDNLANNSTPLIINLGIVIHKVCQCP
jgi:hypothetical protein